MPICVVVTLEAIAALYGSGRPARLVTASIDDGLNDDAFIVPGLGDSGTGSSGLADAWRYQSLSDIVVLKAFG